MMPDTHEPNHLGARFNAAVSSELRILAHGPRRDYDAVLPTIPFRWGQWPGRGPGQSPQAREADHVRPGEFPNLAALRPRLLSRHWHLDFELRPITQFYAGAMFNPR
jgi:hypothetical protein